MLADLREIFDQKLDRQAALHLELAVDARAAPFPAPRWTDRWRGSRCASRRSRVSMLLEAHGERIGLLPGRGGGAPDADGARGAARRQQRRHDGRAEMLERHLVAEEERSRWSSSPRPPPSSALRSLPRLSAATSSPRVARPALRATGSSRLSTRYCLSADSTRPERSLRHLRRKS